MHRALASGQRVPTGGRRSKPSPPFCVRSYTRARRPPGDGAGLNEGPHREDWPAFPALRAVRDGDKPYCCSSVVVSSGASPRRTAQRPELRSEKKMTPLWGWAPQTCGAFGRNPSGSSGRKRAISRPWR